MHRGVQGCVCRIRHHALHGQKCKRSVRVRRGDKWLRGFDNDVRDFMLTEYTAQGIDVKFNSNIAKIEKMATGLKATLEDGSVLEADVIMYATGRVPKTKNLGLEEAGVTMDANGAIVVDEGFQTSVDSIFAVGDVINRIQLTPGENRLSAQRACWHLARGRGAAACQTPH